jgi:hypothetical protein
VLSQDRAPSASTRTLCRPAGRSTVAGSGVGAGAGAAAPSSAVPASTTSRAPGVEALIAS